MRIGLLADRTGTTVPTIRYYEAIGLLRQAARQSGGQRTYDNEDARRLTFIRRCRDFDFSIEEVRSLLSSMNDGTSSCTATRDLAELQLDKVRRKLADLKALEATFASMVMNCNSRCVGGPAPDCVIFDDLSKRHSVVSGQRGPQRRHRKAAIGAALGYRCRSVFRRLPRHVDRRVRRRERTTL
jgi:DNA-binding transcriptional MerR regulator